MQPAASMARLATRFSPGSAAAMPRRRYPDTRATPHDQGLILGVKRATRFDRFLDLQQQAAQAVPSAVHAARSLSTAPSFLRQIGDRGRSAVSSFCKQREVGSRPGFER